MSNPATRAAQTEPPTSAAILRALLLGALVLPALAVPSDPLDPMLRPLGVALALAITAALAWAVGRVGVVGVAADVAALVALAVTALLAWWITDAIGVVTLSVLAGTALAILRPRVAWTDRRALALVGAAALVLTLAAVARGVGAAAALTVALTIIAAIVFGRWPRPCGGRLLARIALLTTGVLVAAAGSVWIGSTSPQASWFGDLVAHGSRSTNQVAITFDDGPNSPYTERISEILDAHQVHGTFFLIGRSVRDEPAVGRSLIERGHVIGNHTYAHERYSYLDRGYPELARAERAYKESLGVCPALYRPPHGRHTPFTSSVVDGAGMRTVTWDVEASDWDESDPQRLARNILDAVRPGSIILLHDGVDGVLGVDRSVVVQALPLIIEGLQQRGLAAVGLDRLLGVPAYLASC